VQSSRKDNEKLLNEIQALKMNKTLEDRRAENKALQTSMLEQGAQEKEEHKVRLVFLIVQIKIFKSLVSNNCIIMK